EREQTGDGFEPPRIRERRESDATYPRRGRRARDLLVFLERRAGVLDERAVPDAGWAHGLTRAAGEAAIEVQQERVRRCEAAERELLHEVDAPARRLRLEAGEHVRRAGLETDAAADAAARWLDVERQWSDGHLITLSGHAARCEDAVRIEARLQRGGDTRGRPMSSPGAERASCIDRGALEHERPA